MARRHIAHQVHDARVICAQILTGRKRHIVVDVLGLVLAVVVHVADVQNRDGARLVLEKPRTGFARLKLLWADGGYAGELVAWAKSVGKWTLDIVRRNPATHRFEALPHCWIVERTLAWLGRHRRMSKDYEVLPETSETMVRIAMVNLMVHRLHPEKKRGMGRPRSLE